MNISRPSHTPHHSPVLFAIIPLCVLPGRTPSPTCPQVRPSSPIVLSESHAGSISALAAHPSRDGVLLSCGADGSLRQWELAGGGAAGGACCSSRRTFSSAQTAIATCPARELVAVGSETGVLR